MKKAIFYVTLLCLLFISSPAFAQVHVIEGIAKDFIAPNADRTVKYIGEENYTIGIGLNQGVQLQFTKVPADVDDYAKVEITFYNDSLNYINCTSTGYIYGLKEGAARPYINFYKTDGTYYNVQPFVRVLDSLNPNDLPILSASKDSIRAAYNTYVLPMADMTNVSAFAIKNPEEDFNTTKTALTKTGETKLLNFYNFIRRSIGLNSVVWNGINHSKIQKGADFLATTGKTGHDAADIDKGINSDESFALHSSNLAYRNDTPYGATLDFLYEGLSNVTKAQGHRTSLMRENILWIDVAMNNNKTVWHYGGDTYLNTKVQAYPFIGDFPIEFINDSGSTFPWSITFPTDSYSLLGNIQNIKIIDKTSGISSILENNNIISGTQDWFNASPISSTISFYPYSLLKDQGCLATYNIGYEPVIDHTFEITIEGDKNNYTYTTTFFSMTKENFKNITVKDLNIELVVSEENGIKEEQIVYLGKRANLALSLSPKIENAFYERSIADPSIIQFENNTPDTWNLITGLKEGETNITFKSLGKEKTITIKVVDPDKIQKPVETPDVEDPNEGIEEDTSTPQKPSEDSNNTNPGNIPVYRLYHPGTGEHLYTTDKNEVTTLVRRGTWEDEGTGWYSPTSGEAVYRLYSPVTRAHLFTTDVNEVNTLASSGWSVDNNRQPLFYSGGSTPVYRLYNPTIRMHLITKDLNEYNILPSRGWQAEGAKLKAL